MKSLSEGTRGCRFQIQLNKLAWLRLVGGPKDCNFCPRNSIWSFGVSRYTLKYVLDALTVVFELCINLVDKIGSLTVFLTIISYRANPDVPFHIVPDVYVVKPLLKFVELILSVQHHTVAKSAELSVHGKVHITIDAGGQPWITVGILIDCVLSAAEDLFSCE